MTDGLAFPKSKPFRDPKARAFYKQSHSACEGCGTRRSVEVHHLRSRMRGGSDECSNLLALCKRCHSEWTGVNRTRRQWLAEREERMAPDVIAKVQHALRFTDEA